MVRHVGGSGPETDALSVFALIRHRHRAEGGTRASWFATARMWPGPRTDTITNRSIPVSVPPERSFEGCPEKLGAVAGSPSRQPLSDHIGRILPRR
jgi:hypothetical protein